MKIIWVTGKKKKGEEEEAAFYLYLYALFSVSVHMTYINQDLTLLQVQRIVAGELNSSY